MERKCSNCGTWNKDEEFCVKCSNPLSYNEIRKVQVKKAEERKLSIPKPKLDTWFMKFKESKNPVVKMLYWVSYSIWTVYMAIISFIVFIVVWGPG